MTAQRVPKETPSGARLLAVAHEEFGYTEWRPGQEAAIRAILAGHDTLAVMPTGSGKSAIYEIAGSLLPGPTVIVSPLIALQRDQVEAITAHDVGAAALVNSTQRAAERRETFDHLAAGELRFIFLATGAVRQRGGARAGDCRPPLAVRGGRGALRQ